MAFRPENIAPAFLTWRTRLEEGIVRWPARPDTLPARLAEHLAARRRDHHVDDYRIAVDAFAESHPALHDWFRAILEPFARTLVFEDGAPRLRCMALTTWRQATSWIDPDALIALRLAQSSPVDTDPEDAVDDLPGWGYFPTVADHGLERILRRGLADIHVHFEAADPVPLLWLRLALGAVRASELQFYSESTLRGLVGDRSERERRTVDRDILSEAVSRLDALADGLGRPKPGLADETTDVREPLRAERVLLVAAWQKVLQGVGDEFVRTLDRYLFAKSLFLRRHQQSAGKGAGLTRFRDFLDRGETLGERRLKRVKPIVRQRRFERMLSLATEPRNLRLVELRVAPQKSLRGWYDLFTLWERIHARHAPAWAKRAGGRGLEIRFVVHFIRSPDADRGRLDIEFARLRQLLDRQTAILQLFRCLQPSLARHIVGIDVANLERGCPPPIFAPYLQLLRGKSDLAGRLGGSELLDCWARLEAQGHERPPPTLPKLGMTYHAGEDFYHPIDGMRAISGLLDNILVPGDRIGHGLAVGWNVARFARERGTAPLPRGVLFDDLVWLRREAQILGGWTGASQVEGDKLLLELGRAIYEEDVLPGILERSLDAQFRLPGRLPHPGERSTPSPEVDLAERNVRDPLVGERRRIFCDHREMRLLGLVESLLPPVQTKLTKSLRDAGIVIEANPSSNHATGAIPSLDEHPFFHYLQTLDNQALVTINTDDPGVFGTNLEIEFGLMFEALLRRDYDRGQALDILDRSRALALDYAFGAPGSAFAGGDSI